MSVNDVENGSCPPILSTGGIPGSGNSAADG